MTEDDMPETGKILKFRPPEKVAHLCTPEAALLEVHGIVLGESACPSCDRRYELADRPRRKCPGCGRPWSERCAGEGCRSLIQPTPLVRDQRIVGWYDGGSQCEACLDKSRHGERIAILTAQIPDEIRLFAGKAFHRDAERLDWRVEAEAAVEAWLRRRCGLDGWPSCLYFHGPVGTGKSVLVARAATLAITKGLVRDLEWTRERAMIDAAKRVFDKDPSWRRWLDRCMEVQLLVVDEMFSRHDVGGSGMTEHVAGELGELWRVRFERQLPTLITSNLALDTEVSDFGGEGRVSKWATVFDSRVESRWKQAGKEIGIVGPDMRDRSESSPDETDLTSFSS